MKKLFSVRTIFLAGGLLLQLNTLCFQSRGAAGDVDLSFDPGSGVNGNVNVVVLQPDGKVLIGGQFTTFKGIARLNTDGSGDSTFNPVTGANNLSVAGIALQPDGKVLVGSHSGVLRLNSDGNLDPTFSANTVSVYNDDGVDLIAVQSDGKLFIGGAFSMVNGTNRYGIARLNANGSLDTSFNPRTTSGSSVFSIALQPDGKVIAGGQFIVNGTNFIRIARFNADGSLDGSFNSGVSGAYIYSIALQPDGRVLIGGDFTIAGGTYHGIARLNASGSLDGSFIDPFAGGILPVSTIHLQPDGKVLIGGYSLLSRLNADGSWDSSFNPGTVGGFYYSVVSSIAVQSDGRVLIGGAVLTEKNDSITRLNADGSQDGSFDPGQVKHGRVTSLVTQPDGKVLTGSTPVGGFNWCAMDRLNADGSDDGSFDHNFSGWNSSLALQPDGKVVVVGDFQVSRFNSDGSLDNSFHPDLTVLTPPVDCGGYGCWHYTEPTVVLAQADGKVLIGGYTATFIIYDLDGDTYEIDDYFLARFNTNGSLNSILNSGTSITANCLAQQPDGKLLIGGSGGISRLNSDDSVDNSFNPGTGANGYVSSVVVQSDGKVLISGSFTIFNGINRHGIARLNANGSLDSSFNPITGVYDTVQSLAVQPDGKVLIAGALPSINSTNYNMVARLKANGSLDTNFHNPSIDSYVMKVALQPDGNILIGGDFTIVNGAVRPRVARLYGDSVAPSLHIARSNASAIVSWPVTGLNFQLQEATDLSLPNSWSPVAQAAVTNAGQIFVTVPTTAGRKFFRLKMQ